MCIFLCVYVYVYVYNRFFTLILVWYCFFLKCIRVYRNTEKHRLPRRCFSRFFIIGIRKNAKKAFAGDLLHKRQIARFLLQIRQPEPDLFLDFML